MRRIKKSKFAFTFLILWLGQSVSIIGSGLTSFALGVWIFEQTGSVTQFAVIGLFAVLPRVLLSPFAGILVDRWDRRRVMILSDSGAGLCTLFIALLLSSGMLQIWQIYFLVFASSAFGTLQWPAYSATTTLLVPKNQLGRANGLVQVGNALAEILAPAMAGMLFTTIGLRGIVLLDFATFGFAIMTLCILQFPRPTRSDNNERLGKPLINQLGFGWRYIRTRPGLLNLLIFAAIVNFLWGMVGALISPMILGFTNAPQLGVIISIAGFGLLTGSVIMSTWGGSQHRIKDLLFSEIFSGFCFLLIGFKPEILPIALGAFGAHLTIGIVAGSNQAIWQNKVEPDAQGRVFAFQQMFARSTAPLAYLIAGPIAEKIFEPLLTKNDASLSFPGSWIGTGPGRGIALIFILMGVIKIVISITGFVNPRIRNVEDELPDAVGDLEINIAR